MTDKKLIGVLGKKKSGKDTCGNYLIENYKFKRYAFADPIKKITEVLFDFNEDQLNGNECKDSLDFRWYITPRDAFQKIGTEFGQNMIYKLFPKLKQKLGDEIIWIRLFKKWYEKNKTSDIVITDVRFPYEIEAIKALGGVIVKIERDNIPEDDNIDDNIYERYIDDHISERYIDDIDNNYLNIDNNYFNFDNNYKKEDLYSQIDTLINLLNLEKN